MRIVRVQRQGVDQLRPCISAGPDWGTDLTSALILCSEEVQLMDVF